MHVFGGRPAFGRCFQDMPSNLHCVLRLRGGGSDSASLDGGAGGGAGDSDGASSGIEVSPCRSDCCHLCCAQCAGHDSWLDVDAAVGGVFCDRCASVDGVNGRTGRRSPVERRPVHDGACGHVEPAVADCEGDAVGNALAVVLAKDEGGRYSGNNDDWSFVSFPCGVVCNEGVERNIRQFCTPVLHCV